jgi:hypothetical protein
MEAKDNDPGKGANTSDGTRHYKPRLEARRATWCLLIAVDAVFCISYFRAMKSARKEADYLGI